LLACEQPVWEASPLATITILQARRDFPASVASINLHNLCLQLAL
jgi:hypothetical protein